MSKRFVSMYYCSEMISLNNTNFYPEALVKILNIGTSGDFSLKGNAYQKLVLCLNKNFSKTGI